MPRKFDTTAYRYHNEHWILAGSFLLVFLVIVLTSTATFCLSFIFVIAAVAYAYFAVQSHHRQLLQSSYQVTHQTEPELGDVIQEAADRLQVEPVNVFIVRAKEANAYTFGLDTPKTIVLYSPLFQLMDRQELQFILGHEMGHVKLGHTVLNSIVGGMAGIPASVSAALLLNLALMSWNRACEYSADRAGILACANPNKAISALLKLEARSVNPAALQEALARLDAQDDTLSGALSELLMTHPLVIKRIENIRRFASSDLYRELRNQMDQNVPL
jgi:Zn-dependent protease with chaperone function